MLGFALLACGRPAPTAPIPRTTDVREAFDVPPPPGHRTLELVGLPLGPHALGDVLTIRAADGSALGTGDLVLDDPITPSLTVYVPTAPATVMLEHPGPLTIDP